MKRSYERGVTDEFIEPVTIVDDAQRARRSIRDGRRLHLFQLSRRPRARDDPGAAPKRPLKLHFTTMTQYDKTLPVPFVLTARASQQHPGQRDGASMNWKNLRVAETEKYAHVTYFFNGGNEKPTPARSAKWFRRPRSRPTI